MRKEDGRKIKGLNQG